ncbi:MAG: hypothetical protein SFW66_08995 [Gammaproteobacteria bacterium]|nr:hypothetical protein [Gammaproteobacteria bacterium]
MERKEKCKSWDFSYRDHNYEVRQTPKFDFDSSLSHLSGFTYYILTKNIDGDLNDIESKFDVGEFHGGITYCRRHIVQSFSKPDPSYKWQADTTYLKIGCDYAHIWDDGSETLDDVCRDAERTIDKLIEAELIEDKEKKVAAS